MCLTFHRNITFPQTCLLSIIYCYRYRSKCRRARERQRQKGKGHLAFRHGEHGELEMKDNHQCIKDAQTTEFIPMPSHKGHHARMMKVDGNDYAHIWESPLPLPLTLHQLEHELKHHHEHQYS